MTELHWADIDGVATVWADSPGALKAGLLFRTGKADETLVTSGHTHLLEHLVFSTMGEIANGQNGEVGGVVTGFHAMGTAETVTAFLNGVCASLSALDVGRLHDEKQVLKAEAARQNPSLTASLLNWRYGAAGYGLLALDELGLRNATIEHLRTLTSTRFTRGNAVLWLSGPPPAGLRLALPEGDRQPLPLLAPIREESPSWCVDDRVGGVAVGATAPRESTATVFCMLAGTLLRDRLRAEQAVSYAPQVTYEPLDATTAHVALYADSEPDRRIELADEFIDAFEAFGRVSNAQLEGAKKEVADHSTGPLAPFPDQAALIEVNRAAMDWIFGREFKSLEAIAEGVAGVTLADLQVYARGLRKEAVFALPTGANLRDSLGDRTPMYCNDPIAGRTVMPVDMPAQRQRLIYGPQGVSLRIEDGVHRTIPYGEVAAAIRSGDGRLVLVNAASNTLVIEPNLWRDGARVVDEIASRIPDRLVIVEEAREAAAIPKPATTRWKRVLHYLTNPWLVLAVCLGAGVGVGGLIGEPSAGTVGLVAGLAAFFVLRNQRRR